MKTPVLIWTIVILLLAAGVVANAVTRGAGNAYVKVTDMTFVNVGNDGEAKWIDANSDDALDYDLAAITDPEKRRSWESITRSKFSDYTEAQLEDPSQTTQRFSLMDTFGIWLAAIFTLCILSFLYADNPFYKFAESSVIGISAAYWMVVGFWDMIIPNLIGNLQPGWVRSWALPGLSEDKSIEWAYLVPLILGIMLLWRLAPKGGWIARWPMAMIIGVFCGLKLISFLHADFLVQIKPGITTLWVEDGSGDFDFWASFKAVLLLVGVLSCLVYFFFSIEHKGAVGKTARLGMWYLMITFGAAFGFTVMGRIALLAARFEFLFDDWLWLIDPKGNHVDAAAAATGILLPTFNTFSSYLGVLC